MIRLCAFVLCGLLLGQEAQWVTYSSVQVGKSKERMEVLINFEITEGYHIQEAAPRDASLVPTKLTLDLPDGWIILGTEFPEPERLILEGNVDTLMVYSGTMPVRLFLETTGAPSMEAIVTARLNYQACDHRKCFYPREFEFSLEL